MTRNEALELVALLVGHYPAQAKLSDTNVNSYVANLTAYPVDLGRKAAEQLVRSETFFPSVAAIVGAIVELAINLPTPDAAWNEIVRRNRENDWNGLDPTLRVALRSAGGTHALANTKGYLVRREFIESYVAARKEVADRAREVDLPKLERDRAAKMLTAGKLA